MLEPSLPYNEQQRLKKLHDLRLLDTPIERRFESIVRLAKILLDVPIVAISLIDKDRQWFKACEGLIVNETPRQISFCGHTILGDDIFEVENALTDERFMDNPLVTGYPNIRYYAGCPIHVDSGETLGTLCVIDKKPRKLNDVQRDALYDLAAMVESVVASEANSHARQRLLDDLHIVNKQSQIDALTQTWNRRGIQQILDELFEVAQDNHGFFGLGILDVDHFKKINDQYGHDAGDLCLKTLAKRMVSTCRESDAVGRWGGEEFIIILNTKSRRDIQLCFDRLQYSLCKDTIKTNDNQSIDFTCTIGATICDPELYSDWMSCLKIADEALYKGKSEGRNQCVYVPSKLVPSQSSGASQLNL